MLASQPWQHDTRIAQAPRAIAVVVLTLPADVWALDAFCSDSQEPCAMCAMALVHSRLGRVVFCNPNPAAGAVASRYRLHGERSLNHRCAV